MQILGSWQSLHLPLSYRCGFVMGASNSSSSSLSPWCCRVECAAHVALLACLHQQHEEQPERQQQQQELWGEEQQLLEEGMGEMEDRYGGRGKGGERMGGGGEGAGPQGGKEEFLAEDGKGGGVVHWV